ncbi:MAG: plasma membrane calcium [Sclerophora amabilis]|nr:MAG: plasma membrane calcium [Sclerophora amabilis]
MADRLLAPPTRINTAVPQHEEHEYEHDAATASTSHHGDNGSLLTVKIPGSPTAHSLDGDTLRSRSNSNSTQQDHFEELSPEEALRPDKGSEADFVVKNNPFAFSPGQLNKFLNPKSLSAYKALGGIRGLERGLQTDLAAGLSVDETEVRDHVSFEDATSTTTAKSEEARQYIAHEPEGPVTTHQAPNQFHSRIQVFKDNRLPEKKPTSFLKLLWMAYNDKILILLTVAAVISLALGLYETFTHEPSQDASQQQNNGSGEQEEEVTPLDWVEGVAICVAILIVVIVTAVNDWQKEKQFVQLNKKKEDREVKIIRSGKSIMASVYDLTVGDILHIEPGDLIPADGIFIQGHNVRCDESSATGESDQMKKTPGDEVSRQIFRGTASNKLDPFIISGSKVLEGVGTYLVTSVGVNSSFGKTMMAVRQETEQTPLQVKLNGLAGAIAKLGTAAALLLLGVLLIRFLAGLPTNTDTPAMKASTFMDILIVAITIIVVAVPEGLPLAVTLALAYATTQMLKENNLVRILRSCETMGNATTICSDKTGTLTQNKMTVVSGMLGSDTKFSTIAKDTAQEKSDDIQSPQVVIGGLSTEVKDVLRESIVLNSTAFEGEQDGVQTFIGSKTETALLMFAKDHLGLGSVAEERASSAVAQLIPFDSGRKCMGIVIRLPSGGYRLFVKGAAEILLAQCTKIVSGDSSSLRVEDMSEVTNYNVATTIDTYAQNSLRTIAMLYRDFPSWPPHEARTMEEDKSMAQFDDVFQKMTFLSIVGIQDPIRPGVAEAVKRCQHAGVNVRMVTGDNFSTAQAIATDCGIKTEGGIVMEGPRFRQLSDPEMDDILPRLQVLSRCSPEDKRILITRLKHLGETVAVTGDGTNDAPALKAADIGFAMGIAGTEVAKEASSIILMDDNFSSIVKAIMWGRAVNDAVAKFLQFQITVNITAVLLAFVSAVASPDMHSVLTAVQLLWVNLIMDTFAALALATDAPTTKILDRHPTPKKAPLITTNMWKMIIGQAIYQIVVTFVLHFAGTKILGYDVAQNHALQEELNTMVFNTFVWMQIFNEFNNRRLDNKFNIFEGIHRNWFFIGINCIMVGGQVMIIFVGGKAFQIVRINGTQWAICILCACFCLPWAILLRLIPDWIAGKTFAFSIKTFKMVFGPIALAYRAVASPMGRFMRRIGRKMKRSKPDKMETPEDEEVAIATNEKSTPPSTPPTTAPHDSPLSPPPITITTPS